MVRAPGNGGFDDSQMSVEQGLEGRCSGKSEVPQACKPPWTGADEPEEDWGRHRHAVRREAQESPRER